VAGLNTGPVRFEDPGVKEPSTQCWICFIPGTVAMSVFPAAGVRPLYVCGP
jgi:hypothetical protein